QIRRRFFLLSRLGRDRKEINAPRVLRLDLSLTHSNFGQSRAEVIDANDLNEALSQIRDSVFDLVLVGTDRSESIWLHSLKSAREAASATRFVIVSASDTRANILEVLAAGFHGFISKRQSDADILSAITDVLSGRVYVPESLAEADEGDPLDSRFGREAPATILTDADVLKLTKRQREVLSLLARGLSNKEIARALAIAEATTKIHLAAILRALGVRNRTEAAYKAASLIDPTSAPASIDWDLSCDRDRPPPPSRTKPRSASAGPTREYALSSAGARTGLSHASEPQASPRSADRSASSLQPRK
ncbi:MAG: response regulator transcription factor, partial [Rhodoplanes sp.]